MAKRKGRGAAEGSESTATEATEGNKKGGRPAVDPNETKAARFLRLAPARIGAALKRIKAVGHLAGSNYEYNREQVDKLSAALTQTLRAELAKFDPDRKPGEKRKSKDETWSF